MYEMVWCGRHHSLTLDARYPELQVSSHKHKTYTEANVGAFLW